MKIGYDASQTGFQKTGCGYFAYSLITHLAGIDKKNTYLLYPTFGDSYWDAHDGAHTVKFSQSNVLQGKGHASFLEAKIFWANPPNDCETFLGSPDIVHANNFFCPPNLKQAKLVYTFYDFGYVEHPELTSEENRMVCFDGNFSASLYADCVITISETSRRQFLKIFPHFRREKTAVVYPASRFEYRTDCPRPRELGYLSPDQFLMNVGTLEIKKNQLGLVNAYARAKRYLNHTLPLVLIGKDGGGLTAIQKAVQELGLSQEVIIMPYASDEALQWLYQNCFAFVFPSFFEGFGMPIMEAMALGAPVVASNSSCIPEITDGAAYLVSPDSQDEITDAIIRLGLGEIKREEFRYKGFERSASFSWKKTAEKVLKCYERVLAGPEKSPQDARYAATTSSQGPSIRTLPASSHTAR